MLDQWEKLPADESTKSTYKLQGIRPDITGAADKAGVRGLKMSEANGTQFVGLPAILPAGSVVQLSKRGFPTEESFARIPADQNVTVRSLDYDWLKLEVAGVNEDVFVPATMLFQLAGEAIQKRIHQAIHECLK